MHSLSPWGYLQPSAPVTKTNCEAMNFFIIHISKPLEKTHEHVFLLLLFQSSKFSLLVYLEIPDYFSPVNNKNWITVPPPIPYSLEQVL